MLTGYFVCVLNTAVRSTVKLLRPETDALTRDLPDRIGEVKQRMHGGCCYAVGSLVVNRGGGEFFRERFTG